MEVGGSNPCVHIYFNQYLPETLTVDIGEFSRSYFFLMTMDIDQSVAYDQFVEGKINIARIWQEMPGRKFPAVKC